MLFFFWALTSTKSKISRIYYYFFYDPMYLHKFQDAFGSQAPYLYQLNTVGRV